MNKNTPFYASKRPLNIKYFLACGDLSSTDNICKEYGPRYGLTFCQSRSESRPFDTLIVLLKYFLKKVNFEQMTTEA